MRLISSEYGNHHNICLFCMVVAPHIDFLRFNSTCLQAHTSLKVQAEGK